MGIRNQKKMTVEELEKIIKTGDVVLSRTGFNIFNPLSYLSAAIRLFAKTHYNHASLVIFNWGKPFTNEAIGRGVITHRFGTRIKGKEVKILRPKKFINRSQVARTANQVTGLSKYDFVGLIHQAIYLTTGKWFGKETDAAANRMYCFEYVAWVYKRWFPEWYRVTPGEIINGKEFKTVLTTTVE